MRRHLARRALVNILPANVLWPILVFPWAAVQFASTYQKGHSPAVMSGLTPAQQAAAEPDVSWSRVWAVIGLLFCWAPIVGLVTAGLAYLLNRKTRGWQRSVSVVALVVSGLIHLAIIVFMVAGAVAG
jgi:hypothetical protein